LVSPTELNVLAEKMKAASQPRAKVS